MTLCNKKASDFKQNFETSNSQPLSRECSQWIEMSEYPKIMNRETGFGSALAYSLRYRTTPGWKDFESGLVRVTVLF